MLARLWKSCCLILCTTVVLVSSFSVDLKPISTSFSPPAQQQKVPFAMVHAFTGAFVTSPLIAMAEEIDDYEYGAVDAPIAIPIVGGILAIATALLPVLLRGGEEAFEEMKERDSDTFGKRNNILDSKK